MFTRKLFNKKSTKSVRRKLRRETWRIVKQILPGRFTYALEVGFSEGFDAYRRARQAYAAQAGRPDDNRVPETAFSTTPGAPRKVEIAYGQDDLAPIEQHCLPDTAMVQDRALVPSNKEAVALVICCAFTGRHGLFDLVIREALQARQSHDVRWVICGSSDEDWAFIQHQRQRDPRISGIIVENAPLGRKWQTAMATAHQLYQAQRFAITGSDDILTSALVDHVIDQGAAGPGQPPMMGCFAWTMYMRNPVPQFYRCGYQTWRIVQPLGAGRFYDGGFVSALDGRLFHSNLRTGLDDRGFSEVIQHGHGIERFFPDEHAVISVKGQWEQLNSAEKLLTSKGMVITENSFSGYHEAQRQLSPDTFQRLLAFEF